MNETKECKDFGCYASSASLKFETDGAEPLEVTIFIDRTTARMSLWIAAFKCGRIQYDCVLDSEENLQIRDEWLAQRMVEIIKECDKDYLYYYGIKIIREIESERTIHYGLNMDLKWKDFPERLKVLFDSLKEK